MAVPGFRTALKEYESDKVKDRVSGGERLREIFGNRENLLAFQEHAGNRGGEGWANLFRGLFSAVHTERKAVLKRGATAQADKRLADAVSLVRWFAERSVHYLSRTTLLNMVRHMTALLVSSSQVFPPTVRDYAKALRTLLSYPPHLENLEEQDWKRLMSICWAAALGDAVVADEQWEDEGHDELDETQDMDDDMLGDPSLGSRPKAAAISQEATELLSLIPILLASPRAPLIPPLPDKAPPDAAPPIPQSLAYSILLKVIRFLEGRPAETAGHLPILRSCNIILVELELNGRDELVQAGVKLLPKLVALWSTRSKALREQLLIALRLLLPWLCHETVDERLREAVQESLSRLSEAIGKESALRWGIEPLDLHSLRIMQSGEKVEKPFRLGPIEPGFDFTHEMAFGWTVQQLYAEVIAYLYSNSISVKAEPLSTSTSGPSTGRSAKRRKVEDPLDTLLTGVRLGLTASRLLNLQILSFILCDHHSHIRAPEQALIRATVLEGIEADDENLQSWSFICLAFVQSAFGLGSDAPKVWASATRKTATPGVSRGASLCASTILHASVIGSDVTTRDIGHLLRQIDVQGPPHPYDSVCHFLSSILELAQSDVRLYSQGLEDKVIAWLGRHDLVDGPRGRSRMDARSAADVLRLLCTAGSLVSYTDGSSDPANTAHLPECPIVERVLQEQQTRPIRRYVLYGKYPQLDKPRPAPPSTASPPTTQPTLSSVTAQNETPNEQTFLVGRQRSISDQLKAQIRRDQLDWLSQTTTQAAKSPERVRKSLDLAVLAILYQNTLRASGIDTDADCLVAIRELLLCFRSELASSGQIATQLLLWQAFEPILPVGMPEPEVWPITLAAEGAQTSGIRSELLPPGRDVLDDGGEGGKREAFLVAAWRLPEVGDALKELLLVARQLSDSHSSPTAAAPGTLAATQHVNHDDDDFGEIRVAETDAMPVSKEALDGQRTAILLLRTVITFRLTGAKYLSPSLTCPKDTNLINALLLTEGMRMLQLGRVICEAVRNQQLRLTINAVDLIIGMLEESLSSYGYSRDDELYIVTLAFFRCSASLWNQAELAESEMAERVMTIAQGIVKKATYGEIKSWRVRLHLILFLDDYLDYDPIFSLWKLYLDQDDPVPAPPNFIRYYTMLDPDLRIRVRAATSCAAVLLLPEITLSDHQSLYIEVMQAQPARTQAWNLFLTDILWKLNCCIISGPTRPITLYHLYEIPCATDVYNMYLQRGLETLAARLGLDSLGALWAEYAGAFGPPLLRAGIKMRDIPPALCGYADKKERAASDLPMLAPFLLGNRHLGQFGALCQDAGQPESEHALRHLYPTAALVLLGVIDPNPAQSDKEIKAGLADAMSSVPSGNLLKKDQLAKACVSIAACLVGMLNPGENMLGLEAVLRKTKGADADLLRLAPDHVDVPLDLTVEKAYTATNIIRGLVYLDHVQAPLERTEACFNILLHLFARIDKMHRIVDQACLLDQLVLVIALYPETFADGRILQLFILEMVSLLDRRDICLDALRLVEWGFSQIPRSDNNKDLSRLADAVARLGRVRRRAHEEFGAEMDAWVERESSGWRESAVISGCMDKAALLWPEEMRRHLGTLPDPAFTEVADLAAAGVSSDSMIICQRVSEMIAVGNLDENKRVFAGESFWHLRSALSESSLTADGVQAFVDALAAVDGEVEAAEHGLTGEDLKVVTDLSVKLAKDPTSLVRALMVLHLMRVVDKEDRASRSMAYLVLRQLSPKMGGLLQRSQLPRPIVRELELLRSPLPDELEVSATYTIGSLQDAELNSVDQPAVWLRELCIRLCDITARDLAFYARLRPFVLSPTADLGPVLPLLVQAYLAILPIVERKASQGQKGKEQDNEREKIQAAVSKRQAPLEAVIHAALRNPAAADGVLQAILETVLHLRSYRPPYRPDPLGYNLWLNLDYLLLAEAGVKVGSFATALLFLEVGKLDVPMSKLELSDPRLQKVMLEVYSNVNDPDGFYGVKINNVRDSLRMRLNHEGEHLRAFGLHGADLESSSLGSAPSSHLLASARDLHSVGLHRTALSITQSVRGQIDQAATANDLLFEIAWRTGDWDLPIPPSKQMSSAGAFYSTLRSLHRSRDQESVRMAVDSAMKSEMLRLKDMGSERMTEIQQAVDSLLSLREVSLWLGPTVQRALGEGDYRSGALKQFSETGSSARYVLAERLHATRMSILSAAQSRERRDLIGDMTSPLHECIRDLQIKAHLGFSAYSRISGNIQASINAITAAQQIEGATMSNATADEYGEVLWAQHEHGLSLQLAEELRAGLDIGVKATGGRCGILTGRIAHWSYRSKLRAVKETDETFAEALKLLRAHKTSEAELANLANDYANFAAEQQAAQRSAPELIALRTYRDRRMVELAELEAEERAPPVVPSGKRKSTGGQADQSSRVDTAREHSKKALQFNLENDMKSIRDYEDKIDTLTKHSLRMFAAALKTSDGFDDSLMKMCSIWLAHSDPSTAEDERAAERADGIAKHFDSHLEHIPSIKLVPAGPQLAARLFAPIVRNTFNDQLNNALARVSRDHPFHILYQIIPLAEGWKVSRGKKSGPAVAGGRAEAAYDILTLNKSNNVSDFTQLATRDMIYFTKVATPWCLDPAPQDHKGRSPPSVNISSSEPIRKMSNLHIPIATRIPPLRADLDYSTVPTIHQYGSSYVVLGGLHRPKKMRVDDSAGGIYHELFKGDDETRQDAVLGQVFGIANKILADDSQTKTRNLRFRTYVVIPLAHKSGILEFVAGQSIGDYLKPAHDRYRGEGDVSSSHFRAALVAVQEKKLGDPVKLRAVYEKYLPLFPPVMRHFFTEKHKDPMGWFAMRLNYSRSLAVTSMVGWVLGIGDRHLSNIMIDLKTGESIQIDFGVIFEAGMALAIPEKVPFRLTHDTVDGLGISGVEGTFRRCCEHTIRVLRAHGDLILTVLEVFKHDPLYAWETKAEENERLAKIARGVQVELNTSANILEKADRVLGSVRQKLGDKLSVEYTVNMLVQEAMDIDNLATIYVGWHAWY